MSNISQARKTLVSRVLHGGGEASSTMRRAAFDNAGMTGPVSRLIDKVAKHAYNLTDDQIFELVVCAAIGQAARQYEAALTAIEAATGATAHASRDSR